MRRTRRVISSLTPARSATSATVIRDGSGHRAAPATSSAIVARRVRGAQVLDRDTSAEEVRRESSLRVRIRGAGIDEAGRQVVIGHAAHDDAIMRLRPRALRYPCDRHAGSGLLDPRLPKIAACSTRSIPRPRTSSSAS